MTGTTGDIIPIVIIPVLALAFWLGMIFHVNSHPEWSSQARADAGSRHPLEGRVPAQRLGTAGPAVPGQRSPAAADEVAAEHERASEPRR